MKKVILALVAIMFCTIAFDANAQNSKALDRARKKEYKEKKKEYKKGKWQIFNTSHTLDVALLTHYENLSKEGVIEIASTAVSTIQDVGKTALRTNAYAEYASTAGQTLRGRITEDLGANLSPEEVQDFEHFYAAYEAAIEKEIKGEVQFSYAVYRQVKRGDQQVFEFQGYFLVDAEAATQARIRAFESAARESEAAQKYAEKVSSFVREAF